MTSEESIVRSKTCLFHSANRTFMLKYWKVIRSICSS